MGTVTLWFTSGDESKWNAETLTYTDDDNSFKVSGVIAGCLQACKKDEWNAF